jgi:hypothetical protein
MATRPDARKPSPVGKSAGESSVRRKAVSLMAESRRRLSSSSSSSSSIHSFSLPPPCFPRNCVPPGLFFRDSITLQRAPQPVLGPRPYQVVRRRPPTISHVLFPLPLPYCPLGSVLYLFQILAAALCEKKILIVPGLRQCRRDPVLESARRQGREELE